jgi:hypothetical protein
MMAMSQKPKLQWWSDLSQSLCLNYSMLFQSTIFFHQTVCIFTILGIFAFIFYSKNYNLMQFLILLVLCIDYNHLYITTKAHNLYTLTNYL